MDDTDYNCYNAYFDTIYYSQKDVSDIGKMAPAYIREPKWEECFAIAFLKRFNDY